MTTITGWRVTSGDASGAVLKLDEPVSFWGGIGPEGAIIDAHQSQSSDEEFQKRSKKLSTLVASARAFFGTHEPKDGDSESAQLAAHERYLTHLYRAVSSGDDEFASDADLLALAGEAAMNLTPWRYW